MSHEYERIFAMKDEGKSMSEIADRMGMDRRTVKTILESISTEKEYRPYSLTDASKWEEIKARIIELHKMNKEVFTWKIIEDIKEKFNESIGNYCVSQVRQEAGIVGKQRKYGHFVREPNREKRVDWAVGTRSRKEMFLDVIFADEASVEIENETGHVWVQSDEVYGHVSMKPKHRQRVMIWLGISMMGPTEVKILGPKETLKADDYTRILEDYYLPAAKKLYGKRCRLAHDNTPVHTARYTIERMAEMGIDVMPWPAESPDMMPIENAFAYLKQTLRSHYKPKNKAELVESIRKFKDEFLTREYCQRTIRHIHTAMRQVIRREGHPVRGKKD
ncbi:hypothetical protein PMAYCL1PPCAC_04594 [Pristionchus mayeri]|uniref:Tc1-like transposase DDE domain-containing protein n=1 Tax=Pristionchus mayeri TaxID=1317129 RepID=A0AAN5CA08_9BILA|nr:hypothetical protein PMAYCL1PPCAC_04594 [Pristionchus mayeri]